MLDEEAWGAVAFQVIPEVFGGVEVRALRRTLKLFHFNPVFMDLALYIDKAGTWLG